MQSWGNASRIFFSLEFFRNYILPIDVYYSITRATHVHSDVMVKVEILGYEITEYIGPDQKSISKAVLVSKISYLCVFMY